MAAPLHVLSPPYRLTRYSMTRYALCMTSYQAGDEVKTGDTTVTLTTKGSFRNPAAIRWNWMIDGGALGTEGGETWYPTAEQAIDNARRTFGSPECPHGTAATEFCPTCHDSGR